VEEHEEHCYEVASEAEMEEEYEVKDCTHDDEEEESTDEVKCEEEDPAAIEEYIQSKMKH